MVSVTNGVGAHPLGAVPDSLRGRLENCLEDRECSCDKNGRDILCRESVLKALRGREVEGFMVERRCRQNVAAGSSRTTVRADDLICLSYAGNIFLSSEFLDHGEVDQCAQLRVSESESVDAIGASSSIKLIQRAPKVTCYQLLISNAQTFRKGRRSTRYRAVSEKFNFPGNSFLC